MRISDWSSDVCSSDLSIVVMLLAKPFYATFTPKQIADSHATSGALYASSFDSPAAVDAITEAAIAAGGREAHAPEAHGLMFNGAFEDSAGHRWGPFWSAPGPPRPGPPAHPPSAPPPARPTA